MVLAFDTSIGYADGDITNMLEREWCNMSKQTIKSLTRKGWSQKKIALKLHIRKEKVVAAQRKLGIGKRVASPFWEDVRREKEIHGLSHEKAIKSIKFSKKWFTKRQARLKGVAKARDEMREKWHRIRMGEMERDWWKTTDEGEELLESGQYD